jgi:hypothetical protein
MRDGNGDDLVEEAAGGDGGQGLLVGGEGEGVLLLAADAVVVGDALGGEAHGEIGAGVVVDEPGIGGEPIAAEGDERHRFGASGDDGVGGARGDAIGGERDCLQAGGAEAVDGHGGAGDGQAGAEAGDARDVHPLLSLGRGAAEDDVFNLRLVQLRDALERSVDGVGGEVVRAGGAQGAARGLAGGGADGGCNDDVSHSDPDSQLQEHSFLDAGHLFGGDLRDLLPKTKLADGGQLIAHRFARLLIDLNDHFARIQALDL